MSYTISELNGVKIYNLAAGKTLPQFLEEAQKKSISLRYNQEYRSRLEVIQDFDFPISCNQLEMTPDEQYIISSGVYAPQVKIFEISELSLKCLRGIDSEVVKFCVLGDDYQKLAFACVDRTIELHAQYGKHFRIRVPKHPRDMIYNPHSCDLLIAGYSNEIYRFSLDDGSFLTPFQCISKEINTLNYNKYLNLVMSGGVNGITEIWDYRTRKPTTSQILNNGQDITKIAVDDNGLLYAVGSTDGLVRLYDVRHEKHILELQHHYKIPINSIQFHEKSRNILSSSKKILKINNKDTGKIFTNIEPKNHINMFEVCKNSGLILVAADCPRMGIYFIPQLDNAPKWCSFLENMTEELEEEFNNVIYDEFKFVTSDEIEQLGCSNLIGSKMLKSYLHGYLMHIKLYQQLSAKQDTFKYLEYKQEKIKQKMEEKSSSRIQIKKSDIKFNKDLYEELQNKSNKIQKKVKFDKLIKDDRFKQLFSSEDFIINKESDAYKLTHPSEKLQNKFRQDEDEDNQLQEQEQEQQQEENDFEDENNSIQDINTDTFDIQTNKINKSSKKITKYGKNLKKRNRK